MMSLFTFKRLLPVALAVACPIGIAGPTEAQSLPSSEQVQRAISQIDGMASDLMQRTGIPGLAVAVVQGNRTLYAKGFGVRAVGLPGRVDADTVFQLASMSKPIGASVVAQQVGAGRIGWDTPVRKHLPWFTLADAYVSDNVTVGDLYAHRSGLPDHAGDILEELGYTQGEILRSLASIKLAPFRNSYAYTNYGLTAAATAVAAAAGLDWASLSESVLYRPLGMTSTSSRFADFQVRPNRALGHVKEDGLFVLGPERGATAAGRQHWSAAYNTDPQSPAGGVSSSANDLARWMSFLLASSATPNGPLLPAAALLPAITPRNTSHEAASLAERSSYYGYGFSVNTTEAGRVVLAHNGAFAWGASTNFAVIPSANLGIVILTNAWPTGGAEALVAQFNDVVLYGASSRDWFALYAKAFDGAFKPQGELAGQPRPAHPVPPQPLEDYAGHYRNDSLGPLQVIRGAQGALELRIGAAPQQVFALQHWDVNTFTFVPLNDSAPPGSLSRAEFSAGKLTLEHYNQQGLGVFAKAGAPP